jgi:hypothetical protein
VVQCTPPPTLLSTNPITRALPACHQRRVCLERSPTFSVNTHDTAQPQEPVTFCPLAIAARTAAGFFDLEPIVGYKHQVQTKRGRVSARQGWSRVGSEFTFNEDIWES